MKAGDWQAYAREMSEAVAAGDPTAVLVADHNWVRTIFQERAMLELAAPAAARED